MARCFSSGRILSISTMNFYVLKNSSISWNQKRKNSIHKAFAEKGVRELVQDNDANVYLAISLSRLPQSTMLAGCSGNKLVRTQQLKFSSNVLSTVSLSQVATGQKWGLAFSSLANYSYLHNFLAISLKFPFFFHESQGNLNLKLGKSTTFHIFLHYCVYLIKEYWENWIILSQIDKLICLAYIQ